MPVNKTTPAPCSPNLYKRIALRPRPPSTAGHIQPPARAAFPFWRHPLADPRSPEPATPCYPYNAPAVRRPPSAVRPPVPAPALAWRPGGTPVPRGAGSQPARPTPLCGARRLPLQPAHVLPCRLRPEAGLPAGEERLTTMGLEFGAQTRRGCLRRVGGCMPSDSPAFENSAFGNQESGPSHAAGPAMPPSNLAISACRTAPVSPCPALQRPAVPRQRPGVNPSIFAARPRRAPGLARRHGPLGQPAPYPDHRLGGPARPQRPPPPGRSTGFTPPRFAAIDRPAAVTAHPRRGRA